MLTPTTMPQMIEARMSDVARYAAVPPAAVLPAAVIPAAVPSLILAVLVSAAGLGGCVDQPKPGCIATTNPFAVKLITVGDPVESAAGACTGFGPDTFNADPEIGLSPYYAREANGQPDYDRGSLGVQTAEIGTYFYTAEGRDVAPTADGNIYSLGEFNSAKPDDQNFCTVPALSPTHLVLPEIPAVPDDPATMEDDESLPAQAAVDVTLEWSNVRVYVTAETFGTQMDGDLVDTRVNAAGDTCTYTYRAVGLAPAVSCAATDADGNPILDADGNPTLDIELCNPQADPANGRILGSGIGPNTRYECDPATAFCMIEGDTLPALR